jgi:hypothetical protein
MVAVQAESEPAKAMLAKSARAVRGIFIENRLAVCQI